MFSDQTLYTLYALLAVMAVTVGMAIWSPTFRHALRKVGQSTWTGVKFLGKKLRNLLAWLLRKGKTLPYEPPIRKGGKGYFRDIRFNPITWNLVFRPVSSVLASVLISSTLWVIMWSLQKVGSISANPIGTQIFWAITALAFLAIVRPEDGEGETVPETDYGAIVTFAGMPTIFMRTTGKYGWLGKRLWLDRSRKPFTGVSMPGTDKKKAGDNSKDPLEDGFVPLGDITFQVWNSADAESKKDQTSLTRPAKNRAPVTGSLTLIGAFRKPRLWLKAVDPALDIGDRGRQEYQELITTLVDTDVTDVQEMLQAYLFGKIILTAFLTNISDDVRAYKSGSMIRDRSGRVMYEILEADIDDTQLAAAMIEFRERLIREADPKTLKAIIYEKKNPDGSIESELAVTKLQVTEPLHWATEERGLRLSRVTFGDVILSKKVSEAAEQASSEIDERNSQIASAKTNREAREILAPSAEELANPEIYQLNTILAAAADDKNGNIRVVMVPGGSKLTGALVAAGHEIGGRK